MEEACEELLAGGDGDVFLVAVANCIQLKGETLDDEIASPELVAKILLREKYECILSRFGWDLLSLFTPHLHPSLHHLWQLVQHITTVCPPKEMVLAVLEQMEALAYTNKMSLALRMLEPQCKILKRLIVNRGGGGGGIVDSTLKSTSSILKPLFRSAGSGRSKSKRRRGSRGKDSLSYEERTNMEDIEVENQGLKVDGEDRGALEMEGPKGSKVEGADIEMEGPKGSKVEGADIEMEGPKGSKVEGADIEMEGPKGSKVEGADIEVEGLRGSKVERAAKVEDNISDEKDSSENEDQGNKYQVSIQEAVSCTLNFVGPFTEYIHEDYVKSGGGGWSRGWGWMKTQKECIALLVSMLDYPLVNKRLSLSVEKGCSNAHREIAQRIMHALVQSHCGYVEMSASMRLKTKDYHTVSDIGEDSSPMSEVGTGCFAYLLLSEKMEFSYLPMVYSPSFLFGVSLHHAHTLLGRQEDGVLKKGLKLLKAVLSFVPNHTLLTYMLDDKLYMDTSQILVNLMTLSTHKSVRKTSVELFQGTIAKFEEKGRHRFYQGLLRKVSHSGVRGLLIQGVKNEIDKALRDCDDDDDDKIRSLHFLGESVSPLLKLAFRVDTNMELLNDFDSLMSGLNFLRYLLIRDPREANKTGVWCVLDEVSRTFIVPLRRLLADTQAHCRNELKLKTNELTSARQGGGGGGGERSEPYKMAVQIHSGENLPEPTPKEEIEMMKVAQRQMDMMDSIIVRVEELMKPF